MPVYIVRVGTADAVKIGKALNVKSRIADFQNGHHETLTLVREVDGYGREERAFHMRFAENRIRGEWFRFDQQMLSFDPADYKPPSGKNEKTRIQCLLDRIRWSRNDAAIWCGVTPTQMRYWAEGINSRGNPSLGPEWVATYLEACIAALDGVSPAKKMRDE